MKNSFSTKLNFFQTLGWAFYLACSWTWCIGMFLPVLLIRDYGMWGWVVFAVPNVLGACAMAYVLAKADKSLEIVKKHKIACTVFSIVTIFFQIYFISWISIIVPKIFIIITGLVLFLIYFLGSTVDANQRFTAFIIWVLSLISFILIFHFVPIENLNLYKSGNLIHSTNALLYLTPICIFGFLLCPYLDLTFHKARQSNTLLNSKIAFTIGFCFLFLLMILFTFFYAGPMAKIIEGIPYFLKDQNRLPLAYIYVIVFHIVIQAGFTAILHFKSIFPTIGKQKVACSLIVILSILIYLTPILFNVKDTFLGMGMNEIIYRSFMAFYSLIAPAYVFLFMIPRNEKNIPLNNHNLLTWILIILFALPFYAIGFLGVKWHLEIWLLIGLAIVLFSKGLIRTKN